MLMAKENGLTEPDARRGHLPQSPMTGRFTSAAAMESAMRSHRQGNVNGPLQRTDGLIHRRQSQQMEPFILVRGTRIFMRLTLTATSDGFSPQKESLFPRRQLDVTERSTLVHTTRSFTRSLRTAQK